tara:strand:+ start:196 stop:561 length:366 start_codon:yes stop_codon:yes gene_type:complete
MLVVLVLQAAAIVIIAWRAIRDAPVRREQEHAFLLSAMDRTMADSVLEAAQADILREASAAEENMHNAHLEAITGELDQERKLGHVGLMAEGRAAMRSAGYDPDNEEEVMNWNDRHTVALG